MRLIVVLSVLVLHPALCMQREVPYTPYVMIDTRSASLIATRLTAHAFVQSERLNSAVRPSDRLKEVLMDFTQDLNSDDYSAAGLFDVLCHVGKAVVAASMLYSQHCRSSPGLDKYPDELQEPSVVYGRVTRGLADAFNHPVVVVEQVLGPLESCDPTLLVNASWFPDMRWIQRERPCDGVSLWRSLTVKARALERDFGRYHSCEGSSYHGSDVSLSECFMDGTVSKRPREDADGNLGICDVQCEGQHRDKRAKKGLDLL